VHFTDREWWILIYGMGFGALFLLSFAGGLAVLHRLRLAWVTAAGVRERMRRQQIGVVVMAIAA
jgi:hypothetical protein